MNKRFISLALLLVMILSSVNTIYASEATVEAKPESWFCIRGNNTRHEKIYANDSPSYVYNRYVSYIRFDLSDCLKQIYFADSVNFSIEAETYSTNENSPFDLSIISDGLENYNPETITYEEIIDSGMYNDFPVFYHTDAQGETEVHTSSNIKDRITQALESGNNNTIVVKVSNKASLGATLLPDSVKLSIKYNTNSINDNQFLQLMANKFDINSLEGVSSGEVNADFDLPMFYKGTEVFWSSNNDAVKISIDDDQRAIVTKSDDAPTLVTLTAAFTNKSLSTFVFKDFNVSVPKIEAIDIAARNFNNTYRVSDEDYGAITKKLNLVSSFEGYDVSWVSSNNTAINALTGDVNPSKDEDIRVSLTPTISSDGQSRVLNTINVILKRDTSIAVNLSFASAGALISDGRILSDGGPMANTTNRFGIINFDLSEYIPEVYMANSVKLKLISGTYGDANKVKPFDLSIVSDGKEAYTDFSHTYSQAVAAGVLSGAANIYHADAVGYNNTSHTTADIKEKLIEAIDNGNNSVVSMIVTTTDGDITLQRYAELEIKYEPDALMVQKYYDKISAGFDIEKEADITSDAVDDSFALPVFYRGSEISWTSDKANISIASDGTAVVTKSIGEDVSVTLTASFSYDGVSSCQKEFTLKVLQKDAIDAAADSFNNSYLVSDESYDSITKNITLAKTFEGYTLSWVSSNDEVVKSDSGRVIRSETQDVSVTLTPTISAQNGDSRTLNPINIIVKKITPTSLAVPFTTAGTLKSDNGIIPEIQSYANGTRIGIINFDLTDHISKIYMANTITLKAKSNSYADKLNPFDLMIVSDGLETYTNLVTNSFTNAVSAGVLTDGIKIYHADAVGYNNTSHATVDIKDQLIQALESGDNNIISIVLLVTTGNVDLQANVEFEIKYDSSVVSQ